MRNAGLLTVLVLLSCLAATAQQRVLSGYLKDSLTQLPIAGGTLSNPATKQKVQTDARGFFRLPVSANNLLYALAPRYNYDTLRYSFLFQDTVTIYLSPTNVLEVVTIEGGYARYQQDSLQRRAEFEEARGAAVRTVDRSNAKPYFGLTLNLDRVLKKKYKNQKTDEKGFARTEQQAYVAYRFSPQMVALYTGLKGEELLRFMNRYTPSAEWLRQHQARELVVDYLSEKLALFRAGLFRSQ